MSKHNTEKDLLACCRKQLEALLVYTRDRMVRKLSGGVGLDQVLETLQSLGGALRTPPHYPMRLVTELAAELGISIPQARQLWNFLVKENLVLYTCTFEAEDEKQNETLLEINPLPELSATFA